jgi:RNA recognition motif-containing protein
MKVVVGGLVDRLADIQ